MMLIAVTGLASFALLSLSVLVMVVGLGLEIFEFIHVGSFPMFKAIYVAVVSGIVLLICKAIDDYREARN